jgi:hypothetical protein
MRPTWTALAAIGLLMSTACRNRQAPVAITPPTRAYDACIAANAKRTPKLGRGSFGERMGDSLLLMINGREAWRGRYAPCVLELAVDRSPAAADSVRDVVLDNGSDVAARYGIGGPRPAAILITTVPRTR